MAASAIPSASYSVLAPFLIESLDISRTRLGLLITAFQAVGAGLAVVAGAAVDRFGARRVMFWLYVASLVSVAVMVLPGTYLGLFVGALIAGTANAAGNPATNSFIAGNLAIGGRGIAMGIKQSGVTLNYFAFGALPFIAIGTGWRVALAFGGLVPLAGLAASTRLPGRAAEPHGVGPRPPRTGSRKLPIGVWWLTIYATAMGLSTAAVNAYAPLYAVERLGISRATAGLAATVIGGVGIVSRIIWGRAAERVRHTSGPLVILAFGALVSVLLMWTAPSAGVALFWLAAVVAGTSLAAWNSVAMLAVISEVRAGDAGRASGVVLTGFLLGLTVSPVLFGFTVDKTGRYDVGWAAVAGITLLSLVIAAAWWRRTRMAAPSSP